VAAIGPSAAGVRVAARGITVTIVDTAGKVAMTARDRP
jgi:hypothetical protein